MPLLLIRTPDGTVLETGLTVSRNADDAVVENILRDNARTLAEDLHDDIEDHSYVEVIDGDTEEVLLTVTRDRDFYFDDGPGIFFPALWSTDYVDEDEGDEEEDFWNDNPWENMDD
jgi:hypothetical protein